MKQFAFLLGLLVLVQVAALATDMNLVVINKHHMVSLTSFADKYGIAVDYDSEHDGISMKLGDTTVDMIPYNRTAWVNGVAVTLDQPVVIVDDVTYLPLRFMCETYGFGYTCHDEDNQVVVVDNVTQQSCFFVVDWGWCGLPHFWCYDFDCHPYHNWWHDHNVIIALHAGGPGWHGPGWGAAHATGVGVQVRGGAYAHNMGADVWSQHFAHVSGSWSQHQNAAAHASWFHSSGTGSQHTSGSWWSHSSSAASHGASHWGGRGASGSSSRESTGGGHSGGFSGGHTGNSGR